MALNRELIAAGELAVWLGDDIVNATNLIRHVMC
jgi:hypothetical protein